MYEYIVLQIFMGCKKKLFTAVSSPIPTMNLTCRKLVNETTGNITILTTWEVPHSVIDAIENYQVWVTLVEMGADIPRSKKLLSDSTVRAEVC